MSIPTIAVFLSSSFTPSSEDIFDEPGTWTDITEDVQRFSYRRGRQRDLDEISGGGASLTLNNTERKYDPSNLESDFYPLTGRHLKIEADLLGTTYNLFYGYPYSWRVSWDAKWADKKSLTEVECVDAITLLQEYTIPADASTDAIVDKIDDALDYAGWPAGMRDLSAGTTSVRGLLAAGHVWPAIQDWVRSDVELGVCFIDGRGYVVFPGGNDSGAIFGDQEGELPYQSAGLYIDQSLVYNNVTVTREGGDPQTYAGNATLRGPRPRQSYERHTLNVTNGTALSLATNLYNYYVSEKSRPEEFIVRPGSSDELWEQVLGLELQDTLLMHRNPPGGGTIFEETMTVGGMSHEHNRLTNHWKASYSLIGTPTIFPDGTILDNFNRANEGPPMTGWTAWNDSGLKVVSNQCAPNDSGINDAYWTTAMAGPTVDANVEVVTQPASGGYVEIFARLDPAGNGGVGTGYSVRWTVGGLDTIALYKNSLIGAQMIGGPIFISLANGDAIGIRCHGNAIQAWVRTAGDPFNGWGLVSSAISSTYPGTGSNNKVGLRIDGNGGTGARLDTFSTTIG